MSLAVAFEDLRIPTISVTALRGHSSVAFKWHCRSGCLRSSHVCLNEEPPHVCRDVTVSNVLERVVKVTQTALVCSIGACRKSSILSEDAEVQCGEECKAFCNEWRPRCGRRQLLEVGSHDVMDVAETIAGRHPAGAYGGTGLDPS